MRTKAEIIPPIIPLDKITLNHTVVQFAGEAGRYIIYQKGTDRVSAVSDDGNGKTLHKRGGLWYGEGNRIAFTEQLPTGLNGDNGLFYRYDTGAQYWRFFMYDTVRKCLTFDKVKNNIFYKGELYSLHERGGNNRVVYIQNDTESILVNVHEIRIFKTKKEATMFKNSIKKSWQDFEKAMRKMRSEAKKYNIEENGYARINKDAYKKKTAEIENVLNSNYPTIYCATLKFIGKSQVVTDKFGIVDLKILEGVTQKEMVKGKEEEETERADVTMGRAILKAMKAELNNKTISIKMLQSALIKRLREKTELVENLESGNFKKALQHVHKQVDSIKEYDNIKSAILKGGELRMKTKNIYIEGTDYDKSIWGKYFPIEMGAFEIYFDLIEGRVEVKHLNLKEYPYLRAHHPHQGFNGNDICLGNMSNEVCIAITELDVLSALDIVLQILQYPTNDGGHPISRFVDTGLLKNPKKK